MATINLETQFSTLNTQTFNNLSQGKTLKEIYEHLQNIVQTNPDSIDDRWALFEFECVFLNWQQALLSLQACVQLNQNLEATAHAIRGLIRAEYERTEVFLGKRLAAPVVENSQLMTEMLEALTHNAKGDIELADKVRSASLEKQTDVSLESNLGHCFWIVDSDTRLSGFLECIVSGAYRWLAFSDIVRLEISPPKRLLDLIWLPAQLSLVTRPNAEFMPVYIPVRYPEASADQLEDAVLLAKQTFWQDIGLTGVFAHGQKTLLTDQGDWPLLDIRYLQTSRVGH